MAYHLYLSARGDTRRPPKGMDAAVHLGEAGAGYNLHHNLERLFASPRPPSPGVQAFLVLALGVWAADKLQPRRAAADAWSRQFVLHLPTAPALLPLTSHLSLLLNFLTGDNWTLKMREAPLDLGRKDAWPHASWQPQAVVLFSGGLDSLVGAVDLLAAGQRLLLVSHYDYGQLAGTQQVLAAALARRYGPERVHHLPLRVQFEAPELSLRSRSLLYLALGLTAAQAFSPEVPLMVPENGWISLNPPLTLNRLGTYSTRTTHPHFLSSLLRLWREVGLEKALLNPYEGLPKGEMLARCRDQGLLAALAPLTVSCARPVASRWRGQASGSCGYCYPCLMRRAALHCQGWDRGEDYLLDILSAPEHLAHRTRGRDLRALLLSLKTWEEAPRELEARLWLGDAGPKTAARYGEAREVLAAGFREIGQFFADKGPGWLKAYLG